VKPLTPTPRTRPHGGMDLEQVRRQVNIIVRKHIKGVTDVTISF
jgi:hypothetical protein